VLSIIVQTQNDETRTGGSGGGCTTDDEWNNENEGKGRT